MALRKLHMPVARHATLETVSASDRAQSPGTLSVEVDEFAVGMQLMLNTDY